MKRHPLFVISFIIMCITFSLLFLVFVVGCGYQPSKKEVTAAVTIEQKGKTQNADFIVKEGEFSISIKIENKAKKFLIVSYIDNDTDSKSIKDAIRLNIVEQNKKDDPIISDDNSTVVWLPWQTIKRKESYSDLSKGEYIIKIYSSLTIYGKKIIINKEIPLRVI